MRIMGVLRNPNRFKKNSIERHRSCTGVANITRQCRQAVAEAGDSTQSLSVVRAFFIEKMRRTKNLYSKISVSDFKQAAERAAKEHLWKKEVLEFMTHLQENSEWLFAALQNGTYTKLLKFRALKKKSNNKKERTIKSPDFVTRVYQYVFLAIAEKLYNRVDPLVGLNCKPGCGITAKEHRKSVNKRMKHVYYDCRQYTYAVIADQRKCYAHIKPCVFRRGLRRLVDDSEFVDFAVNVCFVGKQLPIGTPVSPMAHHIVMLPFDLWMSSLSRHMVRYADDVFIPCETKEEASRLKWRIKNYWWYALNVRAKRNRAIVANLEKPLDFCGYIYHRNPCKQVTSINKGYVSVRKSTYRRALRANPKNWGSYFGIMRHADTYAAMTRIEDHMDLRKLTEKIRIDRTMDAKNISLKELEERALLFSIYNYEIRKDNKGRPNWIKCLIGYPEIGLDGRPTGREEAREYHGGYQYLIDFHLALERAYPKSELLPLTHCSIENSCGYIYKHSTNQLQFIEDL